MGDYMDRLEARIKRLKADANAQNDWRKVRIEIEKHGGRWKAENGTVFELRDGAIYQYMTEDGVSNLIISAVDAPVPYIASLDIDAQGLSPERRRELLKELEETAMKLNEPPEEFVVIVKGDWLSKISQKRWNTFEWQRHMEPTKLTTTARRMKGKSPIFNPDFIYEGDVFRVKA
jgi:hypothetical protein